MVYDEYDDQVTRLISDGWGFYGTYDLPPYKRLRVEREVYVMDGDEYIAFDVMYHYDDGIQEFTEPFNVVPVTTTVFERV